MASYIATTLANMNGVAKHEYAQEIEKAVAAPAFLRKRIAFEPRSALGYIFHQPVLLANETGVVYFGQGEVPYNPISSLYIGDAQINANQFVLMSRVSLDTILRTGSEKQAVEKATVVVMASMIDSADIRLEQSILFGGGLPGVAASGIGQTAASGAITASTATTITYQLATAEWTAGNWVGQEGAAVDVFEGTSTTPLQTTTYQVGPANSAYVKLASVDTNNKRITLSGPAAAITLLAATQTGVYTFYWGGSEGLEMTGLATILSNTGVLFGIDASQYNLWQGNVYTVPTPGNLTLGALHSAVATAVERGMGKEKLVLVINPKTWGNLMTSEAALVRHDSNYSIKRLQNGAAELEFASQSGTLEVLSHPLMKEGYAMLLPIDRLMRIGTVDLDFQMQNYNGKDGVFVPLHTGTAFQAVRYTSQQVFCTRPASGVFINGIVNL